jgi:hypothetical protein
MLYTLVNKLIMTMIINTRAVKEAINFLESSEPIGAAQRI